MMLITEMLARLQQYQAVLDAWDKVAPDLARIEVGDFSLQLNRKIRTLKIEFPSQDTELEPEMKESISNQEPEIETTVSQEPDMPNVWQGYPAEAADSPYTQLPLELIADMVWRNEDLREKSLQPGILVRDKHELLIQALRSNLAFYSDAVLGNFCHLDPRIVREARIQLVADGAVPPLQYLVNHKFQKTKQYRYFQARQKPKPKPPARPGKAKRSNPFPAQAKAVGRPVDMAAYQRDLLAELKRLRNQITLNPPPSHQRGRDPERNRMIEAALCSKLVHFSDLALAEMLRARDLTIRRARQRLIVAGRIQPIERLYDFDLVRTRRYRYYLSPKDQAWKKIKAQLELEQADAILD